jgi:methionine-rich copper-binding protein CopC
MGHAVGRREGNGWSCSTAECGREVMLYGPYTRDLNAGAYTVLFRMRVDNRDADNNVVVRIEVNDFDGNGPECGNCVIARRDVRRGEWAAANQDQDIPLDFNLQADGHRLEFRVVYQDIAYVFIDRVEVRRR